MWYVWKHQCIMKGDGLITREDFFEALWKMVKYTEVDYQVMDDDGEGGLYVRFTNIETEEMDDE